MDRRARVLRDLDREIDTTRSHLAALETARRAVARTVSPERGPGLARTEGDHEPTLAALIERILAGGHVATVEDVRSALASSGVRVDRAAVNSILYRGAKRPGGPFELVARGRYKLRSEEPADNRRGKEGAVPH